MDISNNSIATKEAGKALADALAANSTLKELNVSKNLDGKHPVLTATDGPGFAKKLAVGVGANGALAKFAFSSYDGMGVFEEGAPVTMGASMVKADFSGKRLEVSGAIMLGAFLPKCQ